jgi:chromosome segregation ATPase
MSDFKYKPNTIAWIELRKACAERLDAIPSSVIREALPELLDEVEQLEREHMDYVGNSLVNLHKLAESFRAQVHDAEEKRDRAQQELRHVQLELERVEGALAKIESQLSTALQKSRK